MSDATSSEAHKVVILTHNISETLPITDPEPCRNMQTESIKEQPLVLLSLLMETRAYA